MDKVVSFTVEGRTYSPPPVPIVGICIDGCADEYLSTAIAHGRMPRFLEMTRRGWRGMARACLPTFTNVNNCAIVTGTPPSRTGMVGNYILNPATGEEVMTNSSSWLRNQTLLAAAAHSGRTVAMVTAKDKLREMLSKGLPEGHIAFSSEKAPGWAEALVGPKPPIYSGDASLYVLRAGVKLIEERRSDFLYLSLTDYMQHTYAPDDPESIAFYAEIDGCLGQLLGLGARVGITADHGMNGKPNILYLESELTARFGSGVRVICPITDPYVVHHGALGSAVTVYIDDVLRAAEIAEFVLAHPGVSEVHDRATASAKLDLPAELIGDLYVLSGRDWVIGRTPEHHDLAQLDGDLRSHGGRYEEMVPFAFSHPLLPDHRARALGDPRNFDLFDFLCNGLDA
ncbi:MAG: phosphonoacetate hydrolase [Armatimonadota bacterium]